MVPPAAKLPCASIMRGFPNDFILISFQHKTGTAKGSLFDMVPLCSIPARNCLRIVSCPAWLHSVSLRQETVREGFPVRLDTIAILTDRKLFAKGFLSGLISLCFISIGNCSPGDFSTSLEMTGARGPTVLHCCRKLFAKGFLLDMKLLRFLPTGNFSPRRFLNAPLFHSK